jgi:hypothetical protein
MFKESEKKWNVLVFPCGSEIGLEVHRSLKYSIHVHLIGASSLPDHGEFAYEDYVGGLPFLKDPGLVGRLAELVRERGIDAIYPTMDAVICELKNREAELGCRVIAPSAATTEICASKKRTYAALAGTVRCPRVYGSPAEVEAYPVFVKPDRGYGSRGAQRVESAASLESFLKDAAGREFVVMECLPGAEYTVDCFTDRHGRLQFCGPRARERVKSGISMRTGDGMQNEREFHEIAETINEALSMRGSWFFQVKRDAAGELVLLEVACRFGGSSATYRVKGVNFAMLSVFDAFDVDVGIVLNDYAVTLDRALDNRYRCGLAYDTVYVDFDDCLVVEGRVNVELAKFLYQCVNEGKRIVLVTKHRGNLDEALRKHRMETLFDAVAHLGMEERKSDYVDSKQSIFIDDSYRERKEVADARGIPVFSPDMVECLFH